MESLELRLISRLGIELSTRKFLFRVRVRVRRVRVKISAFCGSGRKKHAAGTLRVHNGYMANPQTASQATKKQWQAKYPWIFFKNTQK